MKARTAILLLGCAGSAGIVLVVCAVLTIAWLAHVTGDPEGLWMTAEAPATVEVGDTFTLVVTAANRSRDVDLELGDLDIADEYLNGFTIVSVHPAPKATEIDTFNDCRTMRFAVTLAPGATAEFRFELKAQRVGRYRGQVDQFVGMQFLSTVVETVVHR